jgi:16S rRNA (adenine1518-N6/adenine1519-N6)-dimethyltransferase
MEKTIGTPAKTREILKRYKISPNKALGQNFLIDSNILDKIVTAGDLTKEDFVVEIGPGLGSLTQKLAQAAGRLTIIEKDRQLLPVLKEILQEYNNIDYVEGDVLKVNWEEIIPAGVTPKVIANLPYYITTPIIMGFFEKKIPTRLLVFMVQREVAERMAAKPGGKDYGSLSIAVQFYSKPEIVTIVPPTVFIPQPEVDSAVVKLVTLDRPSVEVLSEETFFITVRSAFQQRRKTLRNALTNSPMLHLPREAVEEALQAAGIDPQLRGERLSIEDFGRLSDQIFLRIQQK